MNQSDSPVDLGAERVNELARNFWYSAILRAGINLDVFSLLENNALTSEEVADRIEAQSGFSTMQSAITMLATPHDMRGRMMGLLSVCIGAGTPLGALEMGALASAV